MIPLRGQGCGWVVTAVSRLMTRASGCWACTHHEQHVSRQRTSSLAGGRGNMTSERQRAAAQPGSQAVSASPPECLAPQRPRDTSCPGELAAAHWQPPPAAAGQPQQHCHALPGNAAAAAAAALCKAGLQQCLGFGACLDICAGIFDAGFIQHWVYVLWQDRINSATCSSRGEEAQQPVVRTLAACMPIGSGSNATAALRHRRREPA